MTEHDKIIADLEKLAEWMDSKFTLPGTKIRLGLDSIVGIIPGIGDTATFAVSAYIVGKARALGVPMHVTLRMMWHIFIDWLIGLIPFLGDIFDVGFKANTKNVALLKEHVVKRQSAVV